MPSTALGAFNQFRSEIVDLDPDDVKGARASREYLKGQILSIERNNPEFPRLYPDIPFLSFGSFKRRTKVRPLDDLDILVIMNGNNGTQITHSSYVYGVAFNAFTTNTQVLALADQGGYVSSNRILNMFKRNLLAVPNYRSTPIVRDEAAVVVDLASYPWSFDLVPAFAVSDGYEGIGHFLIPDGNDNWKRTDPRSDQTRISTANRYHDNNLIPLIRLMKYWNMYSRVAPRLGSYHLETMLLNGFQDEVPITSIRHSVPLAFNIIGDLVYQSCPDPKGLGPPLDESLAQDARYAVSTTALTRATSAQLALDAESLNRHEDAIGFWQRVFPNFPSYDE